MTTVSILVPHFNDPEGFQLTLRSIESQTFAGSVEIVVCDDGSQPESLAQLESIVADSPANIVLLKNNENRGRPYTRNVLLDAAGGRYLTWVDSGDEMYPRRIELQLDALYRARLLRFERTTWVTCNYHMHWAGKKPKLGRQEIDGDQASNILLATLRAYLWTLLGTTQSFRDVGYFDEKLPRLQDLDFFLRFVEKGGMFTLPDTSEPLCIYHKSDVGKDGDMIADCYHYILRKHAGLLISRSARFRRNRAYDVNMLAARFAANNDDVLKAARYLVRAAVLSPTRLARKSYRTRGRLWT